MWWYNETILNSKGDDLTYPMAKASLLTDIWKKASNNTNRRQRVYRLRTVSMSNHTPTATQMVWLWLFSHIFERWKFNSILRSTYPIATALYTTEVARARRHTTGAL